MGQFHLQWIITTLRDWKGLREYIIFAHIGSFRWNHTIYIVLYQVSLGIDLTHIVVCRLTFSYYYIVFHCKTISHIYLPILQVMGIQIIFSLRLLYIVMLWTYCTSFGTGICVHIFREFMYIFSGTIPISGISES